MTNMTRFSVCIQEKRFAFSSIQSFVAVGKPADVDQDLVRDLRARGTCRAP